MTDPEQLELFEVEQPVGEYPDLDNVAVVDFAGHTVVEYDEVTLPANTGTERTRRRAEREGQR